MTAYEPTRLTEHYTTMETSWTNFVYIADEYRYRDDLAGAIKPYLGTYIQNVAPFIDRSLSLDDTYGYEQIMGTVEGVRLSRIDMLQAAIPRRVTERYKNMQQYQSVFFANYLANHLPGKPWLNAEKRIGQYCIRSLNYDLSLLLQDRPDVVIKPESYIRWQKSKKIGSLIVAAGNSVASMTAGYIPPNSSHSSMNKR